VGSDFAGMEHRDAATLDNFGASIRWVYHDPYQYGVQSCVGDYVMQASPEQVKTDHEEK